MNQDNLQKDFDALSLWQDKWQLRFNPKKCYVTRITRARNPTVRKYYLNGEELQEVYCSSYLGIQLQSDLRGNAQVEHAAGKASNIGHAEENPPSEQCESEDDGIYITGQTNYGLWYNSMGPIHQQRHTKLKAIQRSAARYITRNYERTPGTVTELLKQLEFEPLQDRRRQLRLCRPMLFKIVNELVVVPHKDIVNLAQRKLVEVTAQNLTL